MVEFALHCGAYPLCQVCVRKAAHQLLGKKSSQLAVLPETWRCLFRTEMLFWELVHREARVLQLAAPDRVTLLSLLAQLPWQRTGHCVCHRRCCCPLVCEPGASRGSSPGQIFTSNCSCKESQVPLLSLRSCPVWLWNP